MTRFLTLAIAAVLSVSSSGQTVRRETATDRIVRIDRLLKDYVDTSQVAGVVALVLRDGKVFYERAVGWADKENDRRMQIDTIFRIASQTKAVTSVATLILMEEGKLSLNDPVSRYIPSFKQTTVAVTKDGQTEVVPSRRPITIRHLLTHTAGIWYGMAPAVADRYAAASLGPAAGFGWYTADKEEPICTTMERLGTLPFAAQPGDAWVYGYNTDILGCIVERASGMALDAFIRTRITEPLGLRDTAFYLANDQRHRLAAVYTRNADGTVTRAAEGARGQGHYVDGPRRSFSGGAGLLSTARDYARFLEMIRHDGELDGVRLLGPRAVALMRTNQVGALHSDLGLGFGLGFETTDTFGASGLACTGSYGWSGAYGTTYSIDPESRLTIVMMQQVVPLTGDLRQRFPTLVYQALLEKPSSRCLATTP